MPFRVVDRNDAAAVPGDILLVRDNWNDWFTWVTQFFVIVIRQDSSRAEVGAVKIARSGMTSESARTDLQGPFERLESGWFSIGQSENYYETLNSFGDEYRQWFLVALKDCAYDLAILAQHDSEDVLHNSLLRDIDMERVRNRLHRLARGDAALTSFFFKYTLPIDPRSTELLPELTFKVLPNAKPPTNVHVLIGRNGVGKTRCFDLLSRSFLGLSAPDGSSAGELASIQQSTFEPDSERHGFAGLVTISFSPFDASGPLVTASSTQRVRYAYVGLIQAPGQQRAQPGSSVPPTLDSGIFKIKGLSELSNDFVESVAACRKGARRARWARALKVLEADPLFEEANVSAVAEEGQADWEEGAKRLFRRLSSGHCVVLLTITKLIELVEEKSLVLIDEPEGHLHPPLLSAFIRALSDLLVDRNGVAIIATHSPVVLQEVPKACVWIINRTGLSIRAERPASETFGESVGVLTREVFGLEVVQTGFHQMVAAASTGISYDQLLEKFGGALGAEARGLARVLTLASRELPPEDAGLE
jgi:hypothetical protein